MEITESQIKGKPKKVGRMGSKAVVELMTKGGLHMVVVPKPGGFDTLGVGSHRAVARHIAGQKHDISWTELSKADHIEPENFAAILPKYEEMTRLLRERQGLKD